MRERGWVVGLLEITGLVFFVIAVIGLVVFIWGSVSPRFYIALSRTFGLRPTGLALLFGGYCGGLVFMAHAEIIRQLRAIGRR